MRVAVFTAGVALWLASALACGGTAARPTDGARAGAVENQRAQSDSAAQTRENPAIADMIAKAVAPERAKLPDDYVQMVVAGVGQVGDGNAVILTDRERSVLVPIFIGSAEALAISLRLEGRKPPRPLTHDLLESILEKLDAEIVKVQIDLLHDNVFIGSVYILHGGETKVIDSRSSDAIALAVGAKVPIFVNRGVIDQSGLREKDLQDEAPKQPEPAEEP